MPLIEINMAAGRSDAQKRALLEAVTRAVHESLPTPMATIRVWITEFPGTEYMVAGEIYAEQSAPPAPETCSDDRRTS